MKIFLTAFLFLILCSSSSHFALGQENAETMRARADSLRMAGNLMGAVHAYKQVMEEAGEEGDTAFMLASTYALQPQFLDQAFEYLFLALAQDDTMKPLWHADLFFMVGDERWAQVENVQLDKLADQVSGTLDRAYARQLLRIRMREHAYRYHVMLAFRQVGPQSPLLPVLTTSMSAHHDANLAELQQLIEEKGWPEFSRVGNEAAYTAGNVINHSDLATRQQYLPLLEAVCERGEGDWSRYAHILDRTELELGNPQVYGTQMEMNEDSNRYEPRPIVNPDEVDARRAAKGMETLEAQLSRFNESMQRDFGTSKG